MRQAFIHPIVGMELKFFAGFVYPPKDKVSEFAEISGWTVRPKWSLASLFGAQTPNAANGSGNFADVDFTIFGKRIKFSPSGLIYPKAKESTFVSWYAKSDPLEDFGDSLPAYFTDPATLKKVSPEKYE